MEDNDQETVKSPCILSRNVLPLVNHWLRGFCVVNFSVFKGVRGNACHSSKAGAETPTLDICSVREQRTDLGFYEGKRSWRAFRQSWQRHSVKELTPTVESLPNIRQLCVRFTGCPNRSCQNPRRILALSRRF